MYLFCTIMRNFDMKFFLSKCFIFNIFEIFDIFSKSSVCMTIKIASIIPHFSIDLCNVYDYVRKYAEVRMIKVQEKALHSMREGVFDVLPEGALDGLTSEDLRLLLNGVGDINVSVLISYTSFNDESGESTERLVKFKRWLWSIVEKMSHVERQDLVRILASCLVLICS